MSLKYSNLRTTLTVVSFMISRAVEVSTFNLKCVLTPRTPVMNMRRLKMSCGTTSRYTKSFRKRYWTVGNRTTTTQEATMFTLNSKLDMNVDLVTDFEMYDQNA